MNNVILSGRLTYDPELKATAGGVNFSRFTLAVNRKGAKEGQQKADFCPCIAWKTTAENLVKYCKKGDTIGIQGRFTVTPYEKDGQKLKNYEIQVLSVEFLGDKRKSEEPAPATTTPLMDETPPLFPEASDKKPEGDQIELPFEII